MQNFISLLFYIKRSKTDSNNRANIYFRITVNGKRAELSIKRKIDVTKWNSEAGKAKGASIEAQELNRYIDIITNKIFKIHQKLIDDNKDISATLLRDIYLGKHENNKMLLEIFQEHNNKMEKLTGKDFAVSTIKKYTTVKKHIESYIKKEYKLEDIPVKEVDNKFINGLEYYLKTIRNCNHNSTFS